MSPHAGKAGGLGYQGLAGLTYSPWMAAKNHQLAGSSSPRCIILPTPLAYHSRSGLLKSPPEFQALLRTRVAIRISPCRLFEMARQRSVRPLSNSTGLA